MIPHMYEVRADILDHPVVKRDLFDEQLETTDDTSDAAPQHMVVVGQSELFFASAEKGQF